MTKGFVSKPSPPYRSIRIRIIGFIDMIEGFIRIFLGEKAPHLTLKLMFKEVEWEYRRKNQNKWPFKEIK